MLSRTQLFGRSFVGLLIVAQAFAVPATAEVSATNRASHADTARVLAGLAPSASSPLAKLAEKATWKSHARELDRAWQSLDKKQVAKIRSWSGENVKDPQKTLLYLFSGPDFIYANAIYPNAQTYVLAGLEPVGVEPDLANISAAAAGRGLAQLRGSMSTILRLSFFKTKEMRIRLSGGGFTGTLPILYAFMARSGKTIEGSELLTLASDGTLSPVEGNKAATAVKITFSEPGSKDRKTLYYFSTDLSNGAIGKSGFLEFARKLGPADGLLKSASYLLHGGAFSEARELLLAQCRTLIQDDSGIPLKHFDQAKWDRKPFGRYVGPIPLFASRYQNDMQKLFRSDARKPLSFGIGYQYRPGSSNLLLAHKKSG